jgi:hypothetical protein
MQAIANVYEEAIRQDKDAKKVNPMELWDLHHIRRLDDMGFVDALYGKQKPNDERHGDHDHDHRHGGAAVPLGGLEGVGSTECEEDCGAKP